MLLLLQTSKALNTGKSDIGIAAKLKLLQYTNLLPKQKSSIIPLLKKSSPAPTYVTNQDRKMRVTTLSVTTF